MKHIFNEVHYELTRKIAEGGMGMVYEATQKGIGGFRKVVAIKLIREEYSAIEEFRNNFIGEAKLVADLIHTNIVQTYHLGKIGEQYFMTMEFVTGWNLEEFLDRHVETERINHLPKRYRSRSASTTAHGVQQHSDNGSQYPLPITIDGTHHR